MTPFPPSRLTARFTKHALAAIAALLAVAAPASAASFTVNTGTDPAITNPAATTCPATCSLRAAVVAADNLGASSTITIPAGTYDLAIASSGIDKPTNG